MRPNRRPRRLALAAAVAACVVACGLSACGGSGGGSTGATAGPHGYPAQMTRATLVLDFLPGAIHAGIYRALAAGYYRERNLDLRVVPPSSTADAAKLVDAGKAQIGLADAIDVATQVADGRRLRAIMAVAQRPLGGVIALRDGPVDTPADLAGRTVGITGVPSDEAVLGQVLRHAGVARDNVGTVTIGFGGVRDLEHGKVDAFTGFWPVDAVQANLDGFPTRVFELDRSGGPAYPGLVAFSSGATIREQPAVLRAFVAATIAGYRDTLRDPSRSLRDLERANRGLDPRLTRASLRALLGLLRGDAPRLGVLRPARLRELSAWMQRSGLTERRLPVRQLATNAFLPAR